MAPKNTNFTIFKQTLPKAGFIWDSSPEIPSSLRRDQIVANRLRPALGAADFKRANVEPLLAQVFTRGAAIAGAFSTIDASFRLLLRRFVPFAAGSAQGSHRISDKVWVELVKALLSGRAAWLAAPRPPLDRSQHGAMAHSIDAFNDAIAGKWDEVVSADGLTLEDLAGEDLGDSDAEGNDDDEDDNKGVSDEALWGLIAHAEIPSGMQNLTLAGDAEMGGVEGGGEREEEEEEEEEGEEEGEEEAADADAMEMDE